VPVPTSGRLGGDGPDRWGCGAGGRHGPASLAERRKFGLPRTRYGYRRALPFYPLGYRRVGGVGVRWPTQHHQPGPCPRCPR